MTKNENPTPPPSRHQLALMIWLCVFPTLTVINVTLADWLAPMPPVLRTFLLATIAVPIVIYGLMPHLQRARANLLTRAGKRQPLTHPSTCPVTIVRSCPRVHGGRPRVRADSVPSRGRWSASAVTAQMFPLTFSGSR